MDSCKPGRSDERAENHRATFTRGFEMKVTPTPTVRDMNDAIAKLESRGFVRVATVMPGNRDIWDRNYGIRFLRGDGSAFWLNWTTIGNLPE